MQQHIQIGRSRAARAVYSLDDVALLPTRRTRSSHDIDVSWKIDAYTFDLPFMADATDSIMTPESAIAFGKAGGLPVINAEGLLGRVEDIDEAVAAVIKAEFGDPTADDDEIPVADHAATDAAEDADAVGAEDADAADEELGWGVALLQKLHALPIDHERLAQALGEIRDSGIRFGVRVSPQNAAELAPVVIAAGADLLVIQGTLISAEHVQRGGEPLNLKEFITSLDVPVIAGGVGDYTTALHLMRAGAAGVIIGSGSTTNSYVLGIETPMATAIAEAAAARRDYLDETGGRYVHIIANGEFTGSGTIAKALACGADAVVLGSIMASVSGSYWPAVAAHPNQPRGFVSFSSEIGKPTLALEKFLFGPTSEVFGMENIVGGIKRAMAKCGYTDIKSFQKAELVASPR